MSADLDELMASIDQAEPNVVITDIRMPPTGTDEGIRAANELRRTHPSVGVVVLSQYVDAAYAVALFDGGSEGHADLLKERVAIRPSWRAPCAAWPTGGRPSIRRWSRCW